MRNRPFRSIRICIVWRHVRETGTRYRANNGVSGKVLPAKLLKVGFPREYVTVGLNYCFKFYDCPVCLTTEHQRNVGRKRN